LSKQTTIANVGNSHYEISLPNAEKDTVFAEEEITILFVASMVMPSVSVRVSFAFTSAPCTTHSAAVGVDPAATATLTVAAVEAVLQTVIVETTAAVDAGTVYRVAYVPTAAVPWACPKTL